MEHLTTTFLEDMSVRSGLTNCSLKIGHLGNKIKRNDQHAPSLLKINESLICLQNKLIKTNISDLCARCEESKIIRSVLCLLQF